jgi:4-oxalocrotonate tautomerase
VNKERRQSRIINLKIITMPVINYQGGQMTAEQKKELIERFTAVAQEVTHIPPQMFTIVIQEFDDENLGVGGKTVKQVKEELGKK